MELQLKVEQLSSVCGDVRFPKAELCLRLLFEFLWLAQQTRIRKGCWSGGGGRAGVSHTVDNVQEAETVLKTIRFKVILAAENVSDGSGYHLAGARSTASRQPFHFRGAFGNLPVATGD